MAWCNCTSVETGSRISVSDARSKCKAIFENAENLPIEKTQWDKCVKIQETAADWILTCGVRGQVIVELKGKNVEHACAQVMASAADLKSMGAIHEQIGAVIVCTQYPAIDTRVQRAKIEFRKQYGGPLNVYSRYRELTYEAAVSSKKTK